MSYWLVMQGKTFEIESSGGYLWCPGPEKRPQASHWRTMDVVNPGDIVFSWVNKAIVAIAVPTSRVTLAPRPQGHEQETDWGTVGRRIEAVYSRLNHSLSRSDIPDSLMPLLIGPGAPFNPVRPNYGYLFEVEPAAGRKLVALLNDANGLLSVERDVITSAPTETEREAIARARVGQGAYRDKLLRLWRGRCAVSGLTNLELLRASHIKGWCDSNNRERLDAYNGLLLAANYDAAFDRGLITFDDDGKVWLSKALLVNEAKQIGINETDRISELTDRHRDYLRFHRGLHGF